MMVEPEKTAKRRPVVIYVLAGLALLVVGLLVVIAMQPGDFRITRSATIDAPPEAVFEQINDFHKWEGWSPWAKLDPQMNESYEGPDQGVGAHYAWDGDGNVGAGSMTITESRPHELVRINLEFLRPMEATNIAEFTLQPEGDQTVVTWTMTGHNGFIGKAMSLVMDMDRMVGDMFAKGFANLKSVVETPPQS